MWTLRGLALASFLLLLAVPFAREARGEDFPRRLRALEQEGLPELTERARRYEAGIAASDTPPAEAEQFRQQLAAYLAERRAAAIALFREVLMTTGYGSREAYPQALNLLAARARPAEVRAVGPFINTSFTDLPDLIAAWPRPLVLGFLEGILDSRYRADGYGERTFLRRPDIFRRYFSASYCAAPDAYPLLVRAALDGSHPEVVEPLRATVTVLRPTTEADADALAPLYAALARSPHQALREDFVSQLVDGDSPLYLMSSAAQVIVVTGALASPDAAARDAGLRLAHAILAVDPSQHRALALAAFASPRPDVLSYLWRHVPPTTWLFAARTAPPGQARTVRLTRGAPADLRRLVQTGVRESVTFGDCVLRVLTLGMSLH